MTRKSICRICHGGCGAIVSVQHGKVIKVKGDPSSPVTRGWMCIKGVNSANIANHKNRLTHPLKRMADNTWKPLSWQEALDEISEKLQNIRTKYGLESVALGQGTGRHHYMHVVRFANALGTPNWYEPGLAQCFIPRITVSNLTYGGFVHGDYYLSEPKAKCILFWAHNPLVSSADGELAFAVKRAIKNAAHTIAIDPVLSETGKQCTKWIPIRPGTDCALALAMIHVIIKEGIFDKDFVNNWTSGFTELSNHVEKYTPEFAQSVTGIDANVIEEVARIYATSKPAIIDWGVGIEQNTNTLQTVRSIAILRGLTGNLDIPGGDILAMNILKSYPVLKNKLPEGMSEKRLGFKEFKLLSGFRAYMPSAHIPTLFRAMKTGDPYKVRSLLVFGGNPLLTVANSRAVYEALKELELLVVTDLFMTPTARMAHYVLPAAFWTETEHLFGFPLVAENMVFAQPKITSFHEAMQDEWIIDELSKRLNLTGSDMTYRDIFDYQLELTGTTFDELLEKGSYHWPSHEYKKYEKQKGFRTLSKKVELYSKVLKRMGYDPLPNYVEPPESPLSRPELLEQYPFILITGGRRSEFFHSEHRQVDELRKHRPWPCALIHTDRAKKLGIKEGSWVIISTQRGKVKMTASLTTGIRPDVVSIEHGWWYPEKFTEEMPFFDEPGFLESNANVLTNSGRPYDAAFGSYQLRGLLCNIIES